MMGMVPSSCLSETDGGMWFKASFGNHVLVSVALGTWCKFCGSVQGSGAKTAWVCVCVSACLRMCVCVCVCVCGCM